jgi:hypothetical protein
MTFRLCSGLNQFIGLLAMRGILLDWNFFIGICGLHFFYQPFKLFSVLIINLKILHFLLKPCVTELPNLE